MLPVMNRYAPGDEIGGAASKGLSGSGSYVLTQRWSDCRDDSTGARPVASVRTEHLGVTGRTQPGAENIPSIDSGGQQLIARRGPAVEILVPRSWRSR